MVIKNITDKSTPKVIGIGGYWVAPGEEKYIPDDHLYVNETDRYGKETGKKIVLPSIQNQARLGMLSYTEDKKAEKKAEKVEEEPKQDDTAKSENTAEEKPVEEEKTPAKPKRAKKSTAE